MTALHGLDPDICPKNPYHFIKTLQKKSPRCFGIAGWNNNRTRHACISNDDPLSGRTFQYSPSEAPDVDARLADSSESEGGIDPIRILGTFN